MKNDIKLDSQWYYEQVLHASGAYERSLSSTNLKVTSYFQQFHQGRAIRGTVDSANLQEKQADF